MKIMALTEKYEHIKLFGKLHKILTLSLALFMILGIMAMRDSTDSWKTIYMVWTEDKFSTTEISCNIFKKNIELQSKKILKGKKNTI